jgi:hypothetical protein
MSMLIKTQQIWVAQAPVDFRQSIDELCGVISEHFHVAPAEMLLDTARHRVSWFEEQIQLARQQRFGKICK